MCEHMHLDTYIRMQLCNGVCLLTYMCVVAVGIGTNVCAVFLHSYVHIRTYVCVVRSSTHGIVITLQLCGYL